MLKDYQQTFKKEDFNSFPKKSRQGSKFLQTGQRNFKNQTDKIKKAYQFNPEPNISENTFDDTEM